MHANIQSPFSVHNTEYYFRMLNSKGLNLAKLYLDEESLHLSQVLKDIPDIRNYSFISIGAGPLLHLEMTLFYVKTYIAVDPLTPLFLDKSNHNHLTHSQNNHRERVRILPKFFDDKLLDDIGMNKKIFFFAFNVYSHIQDPLRHLNSILRKGDIVIVSLWSEQETAAAVAMPYFEYVNQVRLDEVVIPMPKIDDWQVLPNFKASHKLEGQVNKCIIILT
jgi:hypothetical protein